VVQKVGGILVHAVCPAPLELFSSNSKESTASAAGAARREQVPHAVPDPHRSSIGPQAARRREEQVGIGLGVLHLVAGHDRHAGRNAQHIEVGLALSIRPLVPIATDAHFVR